MTDQKCLPLAILALGLTVASPFADDRTRIADLLPQDGGAFFADALYPTMDLSIPDAAVAAPVNLSPLGGAAEPALPFIPHFGLTRRQTPNGAFADGVFYAPSNGVELNAKTSLRDGLRGTLGFTIRF